MSRNSLCALFGALAITSGVHMIQGTSQAPRLPKGGIQVQADD